MRKVRIFEHSSLDSVIKAEGDGDYARMDVAVSNSDWGSGPRLGEAQGFDLLLGRHTYGL